MASKILFITSNRLGDAVLSTAVMADFLDRYPDAKVTVVCGPLPSPLFATMPGLETLIPLAKLPRGGHWWRLWQQVVGTRWDVVIDLRDSIVSRALFAKKRLVFRALPDEAGQHKVIQFAEKLGLNLPLQPRLWFTAEQDQTSRLHMQPELGPILAVGPAANWAGKQWPMVRFQALIAALTGADGPMPGARIAISAAPDERVHATRAWEGVPAARQIDLMHNTDPAFAAACLRHASLYVGNDSGLMHIAAAVGVPTLGLFGPSDDRIYAPYGRMTRWVRSTTPKHELIRAVDAGERPLTSLMDEIGLEQVLAASRELIAANSSAQMTG